VATVCVPIIVHDINNNNNNNNNNDNNNRISMASYGLNFRGAGGGSNKPLRLYLKVDRYYQQFLCVVVLHLYTKSPLPSISDRVWP